MSVLHTPLRPERETVHATAQVPIQASVGSRIVASEAISAIRKDVLAKCYGGDVSR